MRLLQLQLGADASGASEPLDFHPMMTVVSGLDAAARARVVAAIRALPRGIDPGMPGMIESHGVLFDLTVENLAMLGLDGDLDPLIRPSDLPGSVSQPVAEPVAALSAEQFLAGAPEGRFPDLDAARRQQRSARETLSILREAAERARRDHADAAAALRRARLAVDEANGRAGGSDEAARLLDDVLFDPPDAPSTSAPAASRDELIARQDEVATRLAHVEQGLAELSALDMRPIEVLVDAIRNPAPSEMVPSERANQLADEFVALQQQVDAFEAGLEAQGRGTASGLQAVEAARAELAAAERAMQKPNLSPDDVKELELAHEGVLEAESKSSGRLRRGGSKKLDEAAAAQQVILDRVGFPTWSSYVMGAGLLGIDPMAEERLERARLDLDAAEAHWAEVAAAIEADPNHRALLDRLEAVYLEAFDILGGDDEQADLEHALRAVQVPRGEVTQDELVEALAYQLEIVGLALGPAPGIDRVLMAADAFLAEVSALAVRIGELNAERDELQVEMSDARHALDTFDAAERAAAEPTIDLTDGAAPASPDAASPDELAAELQRATEDEAGFAEQLEARLALVDASTRVEALASSRIMRIAGQLAASEAGAPAPPAEPPRPSFDDNYQIEGGEGRSLPEAIEFYLLARLAAQRAVSFSGSVPLVVDDALAGLDAEVVRSLLDKLERMSEAVQIIYLSDDPDIADWVGSVGIQRAAVVAAPRQFA
jgi:hypothetical protein